MCRYHSRDMSKLEGHEHMEKLGRLQQSQQRHRTRRVGESCQSDRELDHHHFTCIWGRDCTQYPCQRRGCFCWKVWSTCPLTEGDPAPEFRDSAWQCWQLFILSWSLPWPLNYSVFVFLTKHSVSLHPDFLRPCNFKFLYLIPKLLKGCGFALLSSVHLTVIFDWSLDSVLSSYPRIFFFCSQNDGIGIIVSPETNNTFIWNILTIT